jgi:nicotinic acid mononucleotide adenylyltransferase
MAHALVLEPDAISATAIRQRLRQGERNLPELMPEVEAYAVRNRLYGP